MSHDPKPGTVIDRHCQPCPKARADSYPLAAECTCGAGPIVCADGTADWHHPKP